MRHTENNKYYDSLMFTNVLEHNNNVVVMNPTVKIAIQRFKDFVRCNERLISAVYKTQRKVKLLNDRYIFFKGETEGENALLGLHAVVVSYDEFLDIWVMR